MLSYKHSAVRSHILTSKFLHSLQAFAFLVDLWCVCVCAGAAFFARPRKHLAVPRTFPLEFAIPFEKRTVFGGTPPMASDWHPDFLLQSHPALDDVGSTHSDRVLQNTSGNIQSYSDSIAHHSDITGRDEHIHQLGYKYPHPGPPVAHPVPPHSSFHQQQALAARFQQKKLRRMQSVGHSSSAARRARSYLKSQKYLEYRARPRRDTGKDGEPVWSDELEDAFQQGENMHAFDM